MTDGGRVYCLLLFGGAVLTAVRDALGGRVTTMHGGSVDRRCDGDAVDSGPCDCGGKAAPPSSVEQRSTSSGIAIPFSLLAYVTPWARRVVTRSVIKTGIGPDGPRLRRSAASFHLNPDTAPNRPAGDAVKPFRKTHRGAFV